MKIGRTNFPRWLVFLIDTGFVAASVVLAYLLRFNFDIPESELRQFPRVLGVITGMRALSFLITRTYAGIIRYSSTQDAFRILLVIAGGSILFALGNILHFHFYDRTYLIPFSIIIIESITTLFAMTAFRLLVKVAYLELINPRRERTGVIIFGAGEAGLITKRTLDRDAGSKMRVVAFLDDDVRKAGNKLEGVNIMDGRRLAEVLAESKAETLIIAIQDISIEKKPDCGHLPAAGDQGYEYTPCDQLDQWRALFQAVKRYPHRRPAWARRH
jgi:FlaA1/EpsC-like NDP-sugar epimerase